MVISKNKKEIFNAIKSGKKKVETRAFSPKYKKIEKGMAIVVSCDGETFEKKVGKVEIFKNVEDLLKNYTPEDINPHLHTKEEIFAMYDSFTGYTEKIKEFGLIAFTLE